MMMRNFQNEEKGFPKKKALLHFTRHFTRDFLDFVYPPLCAGCQSPHAGIHLICNTCLRELEVSRSVSIHEHRKDFHHLIGNKYFDKIITSWEYTPLLEHLIHRFKYQRGKKMGRFLGTAAAESIHDFLPMYNNPILIPVPLHKIRCRERGFNQSNILCKSMSSVLSFPVKHRILIRVKKTLTQTKLSADQRHHNMKEAFQIRDLKSLQGKQVFLVDDVVTTGSTMNSCAETLKRAGADKVIGVALSRPVLHE